MHMRTNYNSGFTPTLNRKRDFSSRARIVENMSALFKNEKNKRKEKLSIRCGGFTLVELLIAVALFSVLVTIAVGGFIQAMRTQRQVAALVAANTNINTALEQMAREMRTGRSFCANETDPAVANSDFVCPPPAPPGSRSLAEGVCFVTAFEEAVVYRWDSASSSVRRGVSTLDPSDRDACNDAAMRSQSITGDNVRVNYFDVTFFGHHRDAAAPYPPRLTVVVGISPKTNDPAISSLITNLETTVSARFTQ